MRQVFKDEGMIIFFIVVPLLYPLLYSWIYNNEIVRDIPVAIVDQSHSSLSRQFIRMCDASPDVRVAYYAQSLEEAKELVGRQLVKGVYLIPSDFDVNVNRMQQATISVYCDMGLMLSYKALYQTAQLVSMEMGTEIQTKLGRHYTKREEVISARPLDFADVAIYNPQGGYGSFILPGVLILILQQTLALGIGLSAGTARESNRYKQLIPISRHYHGMFRIVFGKAMCYFMLYAVMGTWLVACVPHIFGFPQLATWQSLLAIMFPYLLACIFFGMAVSCMVKYRENVMLLMVFISVPLLFMSGVSWPLSNIPSYWQGVSWLFPSTFGVRAYVRLNSMGASLNDVTLEYSILWLHAIVYFLLACMVYRYQIHLAEKDAHERLVEMREKKALSY
jgi:ABC-2 type transport system permease protein